jgi:hypothetical protein
VNIFDELLDGQLEGSDLRGEEVFVLVGAGDQLETL